MIFLRELKALYEQYTEGQPAALPQLQLQYADFGAWEHQQLESGAFQHQLDYWSDQFAGTTPVLLLPSDHPRPAVLSYVGDCVDFRISNDALARLKQLARDNRCHAIYRVG